MKFVVGCVLLAGVVASLAWPAAPDPEVARLQRHFAAVLEELRGRDVSALTPAQRDARARHTERLAAYAARGRFPKNHEFADPTPYFIDRDGTRCAMAYLIEQAGSGDYVRAVHAVMNDALVADIARDSELGPALLTWVDANGLTLDEAARIQPSYCSTFYNPVLKQWRGPTPAYWESNCRVSDMALMLQFTLVTSNMILSTINFADLMDGKYRSATAWAGMTLGALAGAVEFKMMLDHLEYYPPSLKTLNTVMGGVSVVAGIYALATRQRMPASSVAGVRPPRIRAAPLLGRQAGFAVNLNF